MLKISPPRLRHWAVLVAGPVVLLLLLTALPRVAGADPTVGPSPTPTGAMTSPAPVTATPLPARTPSVSPTPSPTATPTADPTPSPTGTPSPSATPEAGDEPARPLARTTITGVLRNAETGGPIRSSCVAARTASGAGTMVNPVEEDGTWSVEVDTSDGPIRLAFYVVDDYNCSGPVRSDTFRPAWYENQPFTGTDPFTAVPPAGATSVEPGTRGVVACLARDALATDCAAPTTTLSGTVIRVGPRPVAQACVVVINPDGATGEPDVTDANGRWSFAGLANDTPLVVAVIPPPATGGGACEFEGNPPSPGPGELQPEFYRNLWADFDQDPNNPLFADPYGWATERGANTLTNSASGVTICLTTDPGTVVPRPSCEPAAGLGPEATSTSIPAPAAGPGLADTGGPPAWFMGLAVVLVAAGTALTRSRPRTGRSGR